MAISVDVLESRIGVPFMAAYFRIVTASLGRNPDYGFLVMLDVVGYAVESPADDAIDIDRRRYFAPAADIESLAGDTFLAKCYAFVMAQPDMTGSVAV